MSNRSGWAVLAVAVALLSAPALGAKPAPSGGDQLAELLQGRQAGEPQRCISTFGTSNNLRIIDKTAIIYQEGRTIWVNRTRDPASLDDDDILVIRRYGSDLCRLDDVRTVGRATGMLRAIVLLEDFVPYRLP